MKLQEAWKTQCGGLKLQHDNDLKVVQDYESMMIQWQEQASLLRTKIESLEGQLKFQKERAEELSTQVTNFQI
jgi:carbonic anhydrase